MDFEEVKELVKERSDLANIAGRHTKLVKSANGFKACCPLPGHKEKTPSFTINTNGNFFYCFGCGRGGDVFKFLELVEGVPFIEALKDLSAQLGIELPKKFQPAAESKVQKDRKQQGFDLMDRVAKFFSRTLAESPAAARALTYLEKRGLGFSEIEKLRLGWAPKEGHVLAQKISAADQEIAVECGILRPSQRGSGFYDFFRDRLMIPITDSKGRIVAFSGRTLDEVASGNPKYINSPETAWFKKKATVYGLDRATPLMREENFVCFVEGYFDQWALERFEIPSVAIMGTALTPEHLTLIKRHTDKIVLVLDADAAGIGSTKKALPLLLDNGFDVRIFAGLQGKDPDEWLDGKKDKPKKVIDELKSSPRGLEWLAHQVLKESTAKHAQRNEIVKSFSEIWTLSKNESDRSLLIDLLEPIVGSGHSRRDLNQLLEKASTELPKDAKDKSPSPVVAMPERRVQGSAPTKNKSPLDRVTEETLLWWLWHWDELSPKTPPDWATRRELFAQGFAAPLVERLEGKEFSYMSRLASDDRLDPELRRVLIKGLVRPEQVAADSGANVLNSFEQLSNILRRESIRSQLLQLRNELRLKTSDADEQARILRQVQELSLRLERSK